MMSQWIKKSNKVAVIYKGRSYSYQEIIELSKTKFDEVHEYDGIISCANNDPFIQLLSIVRGLDVNYPVFFGKVHDLEQIERDSQLNKVFLIARTSGTTGRKKFLLKRDEQWLDSFQAYSDHFDIDALDTLFTNGSLAYTANLYSVLHMLYCGGSVLLSMDKNPKKWIKDIENNECTVAYLIPSKLRLLSKAIDRQWQYKLEITTAGEALNPAVLTKLYKQCPNVKVHHYYGAAELGHISAIRDEELRRRPGSVGRAFKGVRIRIEDGVIYGSSVYSVSGGEQYDSAYDYGRLDIEGYLYVTGRKDTQINAHGRKFDALDVIKGIRALEGVEDVLFIESNNRNDSYSLYIVAESSRDSIVIEKSVNNYLEESIQAWQWPKQVKVVTNGIYSETGKYDMVKIGALFT